MREVIAFGRAPANAGRMIKKKNEQHSDETRALETLDDQQLAQVTGGGSFKPGTPYATVGAIKPGDPFAIALPIEERR